MSIDTNSRGNNHRGNNNKGKGPFRPRQNQPKPEAWQPSALKLPTPDCPICGKPIADISSAITERTSQAPAHFDCVLTRLIETERPGPGERVIYLGAGTFAVADYGNNPTGTKFTIKRKIQYEEKDKRADWRKDITSKTVI